LSAGDLELCLTCYLLCHVSKSIVCVSVVVSVVNS
jgi:hypothetical protein